MLRIALLCLISITVDIFCVHAQPDASPPKLYFISDCQLPMKIETMRLAPYRNEEARDSLFSDIIRQHPPYLFFLGDITSAGSNKHAWTPIDTFLNRLSKVHTRVHAVPGNHEYYRSPQEGITNYSKRFQGNSLQGYCVTIDSMAVVMLNSNYKRLTRTQTVQQQQWYESKMDSLDADPGVKVIIVCLHHPPFTNSTIVSSSKAVHKLVLPRFNSSPKARLMLSGHSHNLEYFKNNPNKYFLVLGGGGGLTQPLRLPGKRLYTDLIQQNHKPLYFYVTILRTGNTLSLQARGLKKDFGNYYTLSIGEIELQ